MKAQSFFRPSEDQPKRKKQKRKNDKKDEEQYGTADDGQDALLKKGKDLHPSHFLLFVFLFFLQALK